MAEATGVALLGEKRKGFWSFKENKKSFVFGAAILAVVGSERGPVQWPLDLSYVYKQR